jgi:hypothetical protein
MKKVRETARQVLCSRPGLRSLLFLVLCVLSLTLISHVLLFALSGLPQEPLRRHIQQAEKEGYLKNYPKPQHLQILNKFLDMYTECIGLGIAANMRPDARTLLSSPHFGECAQLTPAVADGFAATPQPYMRYTHGNQLFLKPFYTAFPIGAVRLVTSGITLCLLALIFITLRNHLNIFYAAVVVPSFFVTKSANVFLLVTHAAQFWVVLTGAILAVRLHRRTPPLLLFGIIGAGDAVFSFLNMGSLSLGLPLLCYALALWRDGRAPGEIIAALFWGGVGWSIGFVGPWLMKWAALELLFHPTEKELFGNTLNLYPAQSVRMILTAMWRNLDHIHWRFGLVLCALLIARRLWRRPATPSGSWVTALPALVPLIWICILPGQSGLQHASFTNVILWPCIAAAALMLLSLPKPQPGGSRL